MVKNTAELQIWFVFMDKSSSAICAVLQCQIGNMHYASVLRFLEVVREKLLKHLETPGVYLTGRDGSAESTIRFAVMMTVTKPALSPKGSQFSKAVLELSARQLCEAKSL